MPVAIFKAVRLLISAFFIFYSLGVHADPFAGQVPPVCRQDPNSTECQMEMDEILVTGQSWNRDPRRPIDYLFDPRFYNAYIDAGGNNFGYTRMLNDAMNEEKKEREEKKEKICHSDAEVKKTRCVLDAQQDYKNKIRLCPSGFNISLPWIGSLAFETHQYSKCVNEHAASRDVFLAICDEIQAGQLRLCL